MRGIIISLAFNLPLAIIIFVPIYFLTRKKLEQRFHWGILVVMWFVLAFVNPHKDQETAATIPQTPPPDTTAQIPVSQSATPAPVQKSTNASVPSSSNVCDEVLKNLNKAKSEIDKYYEINKAAPASLENTDFKATYGVKVSYIKLHTYDSKYDMGPIFIKATHAACDKQYTISPDNNETVRVSNKVAD